MDGFLLIDKPAGYTSFDVVARIRKATGVKKVGHAGTLDPMATGLLIVAIGRVATREISRFMAFDKEYEAEMTFGAASDTYDAEGIITQSDIVASPDWLLFRREFKKRLTEILPQFRGEIMQVPPAYSALKIGGRKAYELARKGKAPELAARAITIHDLELLEIFDADFPRAKFRISCSKGTYIRSLAHDMGKALGVGAYLSGLRRTRIGEFSVEHAQSIDEAVADPFGRIMPV